MRLVLLCCLLVAAGLGGCESPEDANSPTYAVHAFHPDVECHMRSAFDGEDYVYYFDGQADEPGGTIPMSVLVTKDFAESSQIFEAYPHQLLFAGRQVFSYGDRGLAKLDAETGQTTKSDPEYAWDDIPMYIDRGCTFFSVGQGYPIYRLSCGDIAQTPADATAWLPDGWQEFTADDTAKPQMKVVSANGYRFYILIEKNHEQDDIASIAGISNEATGHVAYSAAENGLLCESGNGAIFRGAGYTSLGKEKDGYFDAAAIDLGGLRYAAGGGYATNHFVQDGRLVMLLQGGQGNLLSLSYNLPQSMRTADAIVSIDLNSSEVETVYRTEMGDGKKGAERIIGYYEGNVYVFQKEAISRLDPKTGERAEIANLGKQCKNYEFELTGEKLLVWGANRGFPDFIGAYDL
jgi:hypothetical protein